MAGQSEISVIQLNQTQSVSYRKVLEDAPVSRFSTKWDEPRAIYIEYPDGLEVWLFVEPGDVGVNRAIFKFKALKHVLYYYRYSVVEMAQFKHSLECDQYATHKDWTERDQFEFDFVHRKFVNM